MVHLYPRPDPSPQIPTPEETGTAVPTYSDMTPHHKFKLEKAVTEVHVYLRPDQ